MNKIELNKVSKSYGNQKILDNISIRFESNHCYAILGPSGCGKTTLLNIIASFDTDYSGDIFIGDYNLKSFSPLELANYRHNDLIYVQQNLSSFEELNALENINLIGTSKKKVDFKSFNFYASEKKKVSKLSGGEKQKVGIIRELKTQPRFILLDEPSASLDQTSSNIVLDYISKKYKDAIIIFVTHDLDLATKYADEILEMKDGKIKKNYHNKSKPSSYTPNNNKIRLKTKNVLKISRKLLLSNLNNTLVFISVFIAGLLCLGFSLAISLGFSSFFRQEIKDTSFDNTISLSNGHKAIDLTEDDYLNIKDNLTFIDFNYVYDIQSDFFSTIYTLDNKDEEFVFDINIASISYPIIQSNIHLEDDEVILTYDGSGEDYLLSLFGEDDIEDWFNDNEIYLSFYGDCLDKSVRVSSLLKTKDYPSFSILHSNPLWNHYILEDSSEYSVVINNKEITKVQKEIAKEEGYLIFKDTYGYYLKKEINSLANIDIIEEQVKNVIPIYFEEEEYPLAYYGSSFYFKNCVFKIEETNVDDLISFSFSIPSLSLGRYPLLDSNEIVISTSLAELINIDEVDVPIILSYNDLEYQLLIVGVASDNNLTIYQYDTWLEKVLNVAFNIDTSSLAIQSYVLIVNDNDLQEMVSKLRKLYPNYEIYSLKETIYTTLDTTLETINYGFYGIVFISLVIALVSIIILSYIEIFDYERQFQIFLDSGYSKKDICRIIFYLNLMRTLLTSLISSISCLILGNIVNQTFIDTLNFSSNILNTSMIIPLSVTSIALITFLISYGILKYHINHQGRGV